MVDSFLAWKEQMNQLEQEGFCVRIQALETTEPVAFTPGNKRVLLFHLARNKFNININSNTELYTSNKGA
jgi:hypothetical protein